MVPTSAMHTRTSFRSVSVHIFYFSDKTFLVDGAIITALIQNVIAFYLFWLVQFYVKYSNLDVLVHPVLINFN